jgi:hypothetical protein
MWLLLLPCQFGAKSRGRFAADRAKTVVKRARHFYAVGSFSASNAYLDLAYITAAVHNPDRVAIGKKMRIPLNAVQAQNSQRTVANLQFVVGQDEEGHWVAIEANGGGGGLFVNREAAVKYAESEMGRRSAVLIFANAPVAVWR